MKIYLTSPATDQFGVTVELLGVKLYLPCATYQGSKDVFAALSVNLVVEGEAEVVGKPEDAVAQLPAQEG